jgi:hypothetical protein
VRLKMSNTYLTQPALYYQVAPDKDSVKEIKNVKRENRPVSVKVTPIVNKFTINMLKKEISALEKQLKLHPSRQDIRLKLLELRKTLAKTLAKYRSALNIK